MASSDKPVRVDTYIDPLCWRVSVHKRPTSINKERAKDRYVRSKTAAIWREYGSAAAEELKEKGARPHPGTFRLHSWVTYPDGKHHFDMGNWFPSPKAILDGLVDSGLLVEDNPHFNREYRFSHGGIDRELESVVLHLEVIIGSLIPE